MAKADAVWTGQFEPTADSVAAVRHILDAHLQHVSSRCREVAVLVASELATNVVRHAHTRYDVRLVVGEVVVIEVTDTGPGIPQLLHGLPGGIGGQGLRLVAALAGAWGVEQLPGLKTVWAEVSVDA